MDSGTYAVYKGQLLQCSIHGDKVRVSTANSFIALLLGQSAYKWKKGPYQADIPVSKLDELFRIDKEYMLKGVFYPILNETGEGYNVMIPMKVIREEGIKDFHDPREPIVTMPKTGNETLRETKTILHPLRETKVEIIGSPGGQADGRAAGKTDVKEDGQ